MNEEQLEIIRKIIWHVRKVTLEEREFFSCVEVCNIDDELELYLEGKREI